MSDPVERFLDQQRAVEQARQRLSRLEGQRDQLTTQLAEFECETVEQAESLLVKMEVKAGKLEKEFRESQDAFDKKWKGKL